MRALLVGLVAATLAGVAAPVVHADTGVAIDLGRVAINEHLARGGTYQLPVIGVRNPGTEPSAYHMGVGYLAGQDGRRAPESWFSFSPAQFALEPGQTQAVRVTLTVPTDARPDGYHALLQAQLIPPGTGQQVGAAAAATLSFTVKPSTLLEAWWLRGQTKVDDTAPWSYVMPAALGLAVALWWTSRRVSFRVERRR